MFCFILFYRSCSRYNDMKISFIRTDAYIISDFFGYTHRYFAQQFL